MKEAMNIFQRLFGKKTHQESVPKTLSQQAMVLDEIGPEVISCTPDSWTNAVFHISCDGQRMDYSLKNARGEAGKATLSPRLAKLAETLFLTMASSGDRWTQAELQYDQQGDDWTMNSRFYYD